MKLIADKTLKSSLKTFGFTSHQSKVESSINHSLENFVRSTIEKAHKIAQKEGKQQVSEDHINAVFLKRQRGGAETTLPLEYFGVDSKHYFENTPKGADMSVTDINIRPAFVVNDPSGVIKSGGGKQKFHVALSSVKAASRSSELKQGAQKALQQKFEERFGEVMAKVQKKSSTAHLSVESLEEVLSQRQYQKLFKQ